MSSLQLSFIIPVYNRPDEIRELLASFADQDFSGDYEIVIIEDGSSISSEEVIHDFSENLTINYLSKPNTGPGDSRNYGMQRATGSYFVILDSDCILPPAYITSILAELNTNYVHCFGGPDAAHHSFTRLQKAINYSMTAMLTTGGVRGNKKALDKFQPRSFNMGLSKEAFNASSGFGDIHPGEDPDLVLRLWKLNYNTRLFPNTFVYHKRRISWSKFYKQVHKFGLVRPILNSWHPSSSKLTFWFPTLFLVFCICAIFLAAVIGNYIGLLLIGFYLALVFIHASVQNNSALIGAMAVMATLVQFLGYGWGFLKSAWTIQFWGKAPRKQFPHLFFD